MNEEPGKRLVGWKEYLKALGEKSVTCSLTVFWGCTGLILVALSLGLFGWAGVCWKEENVAFSIIPIFLGAFVAVSVHVDGECGCAAHRYPERRKVL